MGELTLAQLTVASTPQELLALQLQIATTLGLPVTAWQPVGGFLPVLNINATIAADYSTTVAFLAQGAYASLAALMVDANGNPITTWMDLRGQDQYGTPRIAATYATGPVPYTNSSNQSYNYSPTNPLHFQNPITGATYTSTLTGTLAANTSATVQVQADAPYPGSAGTSGSGTILTLTTPFNGVSVTALVSSLIGSDAESNAAYLSRCQGKIASISPAGPAQAYDVVAKAVPQGTPSASPPYAISAVITRTNVATNPGTGIVGVYVANGAGAPNAADLSVVAAALQNSCVPLGTLASIQGAQDAAITVAYTVFVKATSGLTSAQIQSNIANALTALFANIPIGAYSSSTTGLTNYVPLALVSDTIMNANPGTVDCLVSMNGAINNALIGPESVPVLTIGGTGVAFV